MTNTLNAIPSAEKTFWQKWGLLLCLYIIGAPVWSFIGAFLIFIPALMGIAEMFIAIPYTIVAVILVLKNRKAAKAELLHNPAINEKPVEFDTTSQKSSFLIHCVLMLISPIILLTSLTNGSMASLFLMVPLALYGALIVIANWNWIYSKSTTLGEEYALATKTGEWKLIRLNRIMAWVIWISIPLALLILVADGIITDLPNRAY